MTAPFPATPQPPPLQRVEAAVTRRGETDYLFDFWSALGWTVLTCGIYSLYIVYRLFWRSVEHTGRRLELLDATAALAWERATAAGRSEELTPRFHAVGRQLDELRSVHGEFRQPVVWTLIAAVSSGLGQLVGYVLLDMDLVRRSAAEQAAGEELAAIFGALGVAVPVAAAGPPKARHSYLGRALATLATCGVYGLWWTYDIMVEGNEHERQSWASDDALWSAAQALSTR